MAMLMNTDILNGHTECYCSVLISVCIISQFIKWKILANYLFCTCRSFTTLIIEKMIEFVVLCFNALIVKSLFVQGSVPSGLLFCKQFCRVVKSSWSSSTSCYLSAN